MRITGFSVMVLTAAVSLLAPEVVTATEVTVTYGSDASVVAFTGQKALWTSVVVIVLLGLVAQVQSLRPLRLLFTWLSALYTGFYAAMIQATPMWGGYGRSTPLGNGPAAAAILITGLLCVAFAIYATVVARKDDEPIFRFALGPMPFAAVITILFGAKEFMFTDHVLRTRHGGDHLVALLWLAPVFLVACAWVARRNAFEPPTPQPTNAVDVEAEKHLSGIPDRLCPVCGTVLRRSQVERMIGNPQCQQWCREGYCSLKCFDDRIKTGPNKASDATSEPAPGAASSAHQG